MKDLKAAHRRGLIPGDEESEEAFWRRVQSANVNGSYALFDMQVDWVSIEVGKGVRFWEAGYTEIDRHGVKVVLPKKLSFFIEFDELIRHELVHAVRSRFRESLFEEFLAYATSKKAYRRVIGPLFQTSMMVWMFLGISAVVSIVSPWCAFGFIVPWLMHLPKRRRFLKALTQVKYLFSGDPIAVLLFFSDADILFFSKAPPSECRQYVLENESLRFQQLRACYSLKDVQSI